MNARCAMITGAAAGIGRALALEMAGRGYRIVGVDVDEETAEEAEAAVRAKGSEATFRIADLSDDEDVDALTEELASGPAFDVVIHNAGINHTGRFDSTAFEAQDRVLRINLYAPLLLTARLLASNRIRSGGSIVFISSLSRFVSYPGAAVYAATKDGLASYARSLSVAVAPRGIHVLTVYPGPTRTAHARLHSPDNSREEKRMAPDELARRIRRAVRRRQRVLVPGPSNKLFAALGFLAPRLAERGMRKTILDRLEQRER